MEKIQMNTAELMPHECVSPIIIKSVKYYDVMHYSGTGFFVQFKPFNYIFFITAKHCTFDAENVELGCLKIPVLQENCTQQIVFSHHLIGKASEEGGLEDVAIYVVDYHDEVQMNLLKKRTLRLLHQDSADILLHCLLEKQAKLRTTGFPSVPEKGIDYDAWIATSPMRSFNGNVTTCSEDGLLYTIENTNWKDNNGKFDGFSGAPVIEFLPIGPHTPIPPKRENVEPVPLGIIVTGSNGIVKFLSINIATNLIAAFIKEQLGLDVPRYGLHSNQKKS